MMMIIIILIIIILLLLLLLSLLLLSLFIYHYKATGDGKNMEKNMKNHDPILLDALRHNLEQSSGDSVILGINDSALSTFLDKQQAANIQVSLS